jgi:hypothetical protein
MKRRGNLMHRILEWDNLCLAFHKAAKGKRDRRSVKDFQTNLSGNLRNLQKQLSTGCMAFGGYRFFRVKDPKERSICAAPFGQRVAHHALINIVGPVLDASQIDHSYACRKNKGQHRALAQACKWAGAHDFYLKMDVRKYFDSIVHDRVMALLARRIKDPQVLALFSDIVASYEATAGRGLPLGNLTSQYLANLYLAGLDHWIKQDMQQKHYLRYMDDMLILGDKTALIDLRDRCRDFLDRHLGLCLKHGGQINKTEKGIGFLGMVVYPGSVRLSAPAKKRVRARLKSCERKYRNGGWAAAELQQRTEALWAGLFHVQSLGWRSRLAAERQEM